MPVTERMLSLYFLAVTIVHESVVSLLLLVSIFNFSVSLTQTTQHALWKEMQFEHPGYVNQNEPFFQTESFGEL